MVNAKFEAYKIQRELRRSGRTYEFKRCGTNAFKEPEGDPKPIGNLLCLYHEQTGATKITTGDTTQVRTKKVPMLLCLYDDASALHLQVGDQVTINSKTMKVTGIANIQEWCIVADISLEVIDNGFPA